FGADGRMTLSARRNASCQTPFLRPYQRETSRRQLKTRQRLHLTASLPLTGFMPVNRATVSMVRSALSARLGPWAACVALARGPSFEGRLRRPPQDEVVDVARRRTQRRVSHHGRLARVPATRPSAVALRATADKSRTGFAGHLRTRFVDVARQR